MPLRRQDASVWSALMAIGGAIGGAVTTKFGISANFAVDAASYLAASVLTFLMRPPLKGAAAQEEGTPMSSTAEGEAEPEPEPEPEVRALAQHSQCSTLAHPGLGDVRLTRCASTANPQTASCRLTRHDAAQPAPAPVQRLPYHAPLGARLCDRCLFPQAMAAADPSADALEPLWPYLRSNPGLLVILTAKASGALTWGLAELIEVELSALSSFQLDGGCVHPSLPLCPALPLAHVGFGRAGGSQSATLGLVYLCTGVGALLGPIVANSCGGEGSGGAEARSLFLMVLGFCVGTVASLTMCPGSRTCDVRC